jgi:hypothetical protein
LTTRLYEEALLVPSMLPPCIIHVFRDPMSALTLATRLYEEAIMVPSMLPPLFFMNSWTQAGNTAVGGGDAGALHALALYYSYIQGP